MSTGPMIKGDPRPHGFATTPAAQLDQTKLLDRLVAVTKDIKLPFGLQLGIDPNPPAGYQVLRVGDPDGVDNTDPTKPMPWWGRKWLISQHMTDGEIVQTAWLAFQVASEHEAREQFTYQGQAIFDPHHDVHKLAWFRAQPNVLKERAPLPAATCEHAWTYTNYGKSCLRCGMYTRC